MSCPQHTSLALCESHTRAHEWVTWVCMEGLWLSDLYPPGTVAASALCITRSLAGGNRSPLQGALFHFREEMMVNSFPADLKTPQVTPRFSKLKLADLPNCPLLCSAALASTASEPFWKLPHGKNANTRQREQRIAWSCSGKDLYSTGKSYWQAPDVNRMCFF